MGKIILNGTGYAGSGGSGGVIYLPTIYSDEEREVGVWTDGKPLYQKTLVFTGTYSGASGSVPINISDLDTVFCANAWGIISTNAICTLPYVHSSTNNNGGFFISADKTTIGIRFASGLTLTKLVFTLQYTKTTDVAGSGNWNTDGVPTHHYSTNEQVIGTYFGKTLYEKGFNVGTQSFSSGQITIANDLSNVDEVVEYGGSAKEPRDNRNIPLPYMRKAWNECVNLQVMQLPNGTLSTAIVTNDSWYTSLENIKIWVRYTKGEMREWKL